MLPLRHPKRWQVASILFLLLTLAAALMPAFWAFDNKVAALRWFENADKWLHGIVFFVLAVWFSGLYAKPAFWRIAVGLLAFGALIEVLQRMISYRTADMIDIAADGIGIVAGLLVGALGASGWCQRFENWCHARQPSGD